MRSSADRAVLGARIRTLDPAQPWATAVAWRGGAIVAVGDDAAVRETCDGRTELIDGDGLAIVPGLVDAHQHPLMGADQTVGADLAGLSSVDDVRTALATERARCAPGQWVQGYALEYATFDGLELSGELVADAVGGAPAYLTFFDYHTALATPPALAAAGVTGPHPLAGSAEVVCRDGRPTGVLLEAAAFELVTRVMPQPTHEQRRDRRAAALRRMAAAGLTAVHGMDGKPSTHDELRELEARGELCVRIVAPLHVEPDTPWDELERWTGLRDAHGERWRAGVAKFFIDGVIEPGTAWLEEPDTAGRGLEPLWPDPERFTRAVALFARGLSVRDARHRRPRRAAHARRLPRGRRRARRPPPHRAHRDARRRAARALRGGGRGGLDAGDPPAVAAGRRLRSVVPALGPERAGRAFRCADLVASGALLALGSNWPVAHFDPRAGMAWARLKGARRAIRPRPHRSRPGADGRAEPCTATRSTPGERSARKRTPAV